MALTSEPIGLYPSENIGTPVIALKYFLWGRDILLKSQPTQF